MKNRMIIVAAVALFPVACKKSSPPPATYAYTGALKGYDLATTACGGKYWVTINGWPSAGDTGLASFDTLPPGSGLDPAAASLSSPINVKFNWHADTEGCKIIIDAIARD